MSTNARIRCRQCRNLVTTVDANDLKDGHLNTYSIRDTHTAHAHSLACGTIGDRREVFLVEDEYAIWIQHEIEESGWTKGKLKCVKCASNVGTFDFVSGKKCECKRFDLPPLHFIVSKIDIEQNQPST